MERMVYSLHKRIKRNNFIDPEKKSYTKINVISTYILFSTLFGVLIYCYRKYTRKSSCTNHARWWLGVFPKYKIGFTVEALFPGKLLDGFLYPHKNTCQRKYAHKNFPGARLQLFAKVNKQNNASFRKHYLDFLAFSPLEKLSLPTGLTH